MTTKYIEELINGNREIEFDYRGKRYSITCYKDNRTDYISFCEFYKTPHDVSSVKDLMNLEINGVKLSKILSALPDSAFDIF